MTNADNPISAIEALLQERQRYEGWMATLETRREITPPHVYERVRTDYEARLKDVLDRLGGRSGDLRQMVDTLAGRVAALEGDESTRRDALSEAELRALVGEYPPEEWDRLKSEREAEIQRLVSERDEISNELNRVQELLSKADAEPRFATPAPGVAATGSREASPAPVASAPPEPEPEFRPREEAAPAAPAAPVAAAAAPSSPPPAPAPAPANFDELAFLQSLSDTRGDGRDARPATPGQPVGAVGAPGAAGPASSFAPPAPPPQPARPSAPVGEAARTLADDLAAANPFTSSGEPPRGAARPASSPFGDQRSSQPADPRRSSDAVPAFLRDVPSEQVKTLKCQECGTMNYPTEWYCERCGGELAAM